MLFLSLPPLDHYILGHCLIIPCFGLFEFNFPIQLFATNLPILLLKFNPLSTPLRHTSHAWVPLLSYTIQRKRHSEFYLERLQKRNIVGFSELSGKSICS